MEHKEETGVTQVQPLPDRLAKFDELLLLHGAHGSPDDGMCAMEAAAWLAGEKQRSKPPWALSCAGGLSQRMIAPLPAQESIRWGGN